MRVSTHSRFVRVAAVLALVGGALWSSQPAQAALFATISVDPPTGPPTTVVSVAGSGFGLSEEVVLSFDALTVATALTDASGSFAEPFAVPDTARPGRHVVRVAGQTSGLVATRRFTVRTDWPQYRFDGGRTGHNPYENVISTATAPKLRQFWAVESPTIEGAVYSSPAVVAGRVYVGLWDSPWQQGGVMALDPRVEGELWRAELGPVSSSPAVAGGRVYVGTARGVVFALRASDGSIVWDVENLGLPIHGSPVVSDGTVFIASQGSSNQLHALDAVTGSERWQASVEGTPGSSPAVVDGVVYLVSAQQEEPQVGSVYAFDAATGAQVWLTPTAGHGDDAPAVSGGLVFLTDEREGLDVAAELYALDAGTGAEVWKTSFQPGWDVSSPAVADGVVYATTGCSLFAFDASDGTPNWSYGYESCSERGAIGSPTIANGVIYTFGGPELYALSAATGTELWRAGSAEAYGGSMASPVIVNGQVYASWMYGSLRGYSLR